MNSVCILRRDPLALRRTQAALEASRDLRVIGVAGSLFQARALLSRQDPDALLVDITFEDGAALSLINDLRRATAATDRPKVLVMAPSVSDPLLFATLCAGADSFLLDASGGVTSPVPALGRVLRGESAIAGPLARQILAFFNALGAIGAAPPANERELDWVHGARDPLRLSAGERYMLVLFALGEPIGAVAVRLGMSVEHVGRRTANIYRKLQWDVRSGALSLQAA